MTAAVASLIALIAAIGLWMFSRLNVGLIAIAGPDSINGVIAFVTGVISTCSSTSGVVLPAFLPTVPGLVEQLGGGDPLAIALLCQFFAGLIAAF